MIAKKLILQVFPRKQFYFTVAQYKMKVIDDATTYYFLRLTSTLVNRQQTNK